MINSISVCGLGKLGSPIAASFARAGFFVKGYDIDSEKVQCIKVGRAPVVEPGLAEAIAFSNPRLWATTNVNEAVSDTEACIFVAPTPSLPDGRFDNTFLLRGIEKIAQAVGGREYLFIIASTVTPGSCEKVLLPAIHAHCPKGRIAYKPELIALGTVMKDLARPDTALIGGDKDTAKEVFEMYVKVHAAAGNITFWRMSLLEAELAKISLNCAITMKISFANQVGMVARQLGADPSIILRFVGSDSRIGPKSLRFGMPFGGPCFPRDNRMFQHVAKKVSIVPHLAMATDQINNDLLQYILDSIPADGNVGILGATYKGDATITDEAPGLALFYSLASQGREVRIHDQFNSLKFSSKLEDVICSRTVIVTIDCLEYRHLKFGQDAFLIDLFGVVQP